jgi:DNA-binding MarR family transcriptional regulator
MSADDLQQSFMSFVRSFGLLQPDRTPCGLELHVSEAHALAEIGASTDLTQQALAGRLCLRKSTVSRLIGNLVDRGWVTRAPDLSDGRALVLTLTDEGADVAGRVRRSRTRRFEALLAEIPLKDQPGVVRAVQLLADAARTSPIANAGVAA